MASSSSDSQSQDTPMIDLTQQDTQMTENFGLTQQDTQMTETAQLMSSQDDCRDADEPEIGTLDHWIEYHEDVVKWHGFEVRGRRLQFGFTLDQRQAWITFYLKEHDDTQNPGMLKMTIHQAPQLNHMADNISLDEVDLRTVPEKWLDILSLEAEDINKKSWVETALQAFTRSIGEPMTLSQLDGPEWKQLNIDHDDIGDMYLDGYFDPGLCQGIDTGGITRSRLSISWYDAKRLQTAAILGKLPFNDSSLERCFESLGFIFPGILIGNATLEQMDLWTKRRKEFEATCLRRQPMKTPDYPLIDTENKSLQSRNKNMMKRIEDLCGKYAEQDNPLVFSKEGKIMCKSGIVPFEIHQYPRRYAICPHLRRLGMCDDLPCRQVSPLMADKLVSTHAYLKIHPVD